MAQQSIFRSAVTDDSGAIDAGYLALFWIMAVVIMAIPFMCVFTGIAMWLDVPDHKFDVQSLGIGIGSVCTGFGVAVGAVGAFRAGDKAPRPTVGTVTTKKEETIVTESATDDPMERGTPAKPLHVAVKNDRKRVAKGKG